LESYEPKKKKLKKSVEVPSETMKAQPTPKETNKKERATKNHDVRNPFQKVHAWKKLGRHPSMD